MIIDVYRIWEKSNCMVCRPTLLRDVHPPRPKPEHYLPISAPTLSPELLNRFIYRNQEKAKVLVTKGLTKPSVASFVAGSDQTKVNVPGVPGERRLKGGFQKTQEMPLAAKWYKPSLKSSGWCPSSNPS